MGGLDLFGEVPEAKRELRWDGKEFLGVGGKGIRREHAPDRGLARAKALWWEEHGHLERWDL